MLSQLNQVIDINPNLPGLIYYTNLSGELINCNNQFAELLDLNNHSEVIGKFHRTYFSKSTLDAINQNNRLTRKHNQAQQFEEVWQLANNKQIFCLCERAPVYDDNGFFVAIVANAIDISAHKLQQQELTNKIERINNKNKATELYLRNIVANLADHVFWEDRDGLILGCNELQAINCGFKSAEEAVGKTFYDIGKMLNWEQHMVEQLRKNDLTVMETDKTISVEEEVIWADGIPRTYLSKKAPLKDDKGICIGIIGLAFDITERKVMENNLRSAKERFENTNLAKSNFIANISHDLRTPLHTMLGIAELLQIKQHYPEQESLIDGIIQSGQNLLKLVEQILQFSEMETAQHNFQIESLDLRQLIENIILEHAAKAKENNIDLIISYCESTPRLIKSNAQLLRRIICNLLGNALKFTGQGHILIAVEPVSVNKNSVELQIVIEDTGVGISKEDIKYIFDRFYRAAPSYNGKYKGSGLGLAIAKQLTERLGGELQVNSQLGMGTTFSCTLNFKLASNRIDFHVLEDQFSDANILIVDDHVKRRETLLKQIPCKNKLALTSAKAVVFFMSQKLTPKHNLIIIDDDIKAMKPESLAKVIHTMSEPGREPLLVLVTKLKNNKIIFSQHDYFTQALSKPLQPTDINHLLAPTWEKWQDSQQRKHHKPLQQSLDVLLVEDEPLIQRFTQQVLAEFGCKVQIAENGKEALSKSEQRYDLILMDIGLPDISGIEVTKLIRQAKNVNCKTPIIALTAHASDYDKARCITSGVSDFLTKPASYVSFKKILQKYQNASVIARE